MTSGSGPPSATLIATYYFVLYAGVGVTLPYLPQHFRSLGFTGQQIGLLAAIGPAMSVLVPPLWGFLADRTRRADLLLSASALGVVAGHGLLALARWVPAAAGAMCVHALVASPQSVLIDTVALEHVRARGGSYPRLRLWGSVGFACTAFGFGLFYLGEPAEVPRVPLAAMAIAAVAFAVSLGVRGSVPAERPRLADALHLLGRADLRLLFAATTAHWIACAAYNLFFVVHVKSIGHRPAIAGTALALGVLAEVAAMRAFNRIECRSSLPKLLRAAFAASALRWLVVATTGRAALLVAVQVLHGLSFGVFYISAVTYLSRAVPPSLRATGQALLVATTFGIGGSLGYVAAGHCYDAVGGPTLFAVAAALELVPLALAFGLRPPRLDGEPGGRIRAE